MTTKKHQAIKTVTTHITDVICLISIAFIIRYFIMDATLDTLFATVMIPLLFVQVACNTIALIADIKHVKFIEKEELLND